MPDSVCHDHAEARFRALLDASGLPQPDEVAHLRRCLIFLWEASQSVVLIDLDELAPGGDPFAGFDAGELFAAVGVRQYWVGGKPNPGSGVCSL
jgi:hypothetical protein